MTTFLHQDAATRSPEMRHELGEPVGDPVTFIDHDGRRIVVGSILEEATFARREDVVDEFIDVYRFGFGELVRDRSFPEELILPEIAARALAELGATEVVVPASFPLLAADHLRAKGITATPDARAWEERRRRKTPAELEGIERAQRAAETAMLTAARMLRDSEVADDGTLRFEGDVLTCEWIRAGMVAELLSQGAESEEILVHSGDACLDGHELGHGPVLANHSLIVDVFPRDRRSGAHTDMTRTFVPGRPSKELQRLHADVRAALELAFELLRPGRDDVHRAVSDLFAARGYPTVDRHDGDEPLREGFFHSLGHGVGLEVHEKPSLGRRSDPLQVGDVVAIEPGLYLKGVGGVRLEDTVLIGEDGPIRFTDPFPYDLEP